MNTESQEHLMSIASMVSPLTRTFPITVGVSDALTSLLKAPEGRFQRQIG